eukprot:gnl/MRDRNA2_/MRDRNA2_153539_c0_seq1.p1 gnl/MRDRNA2_/MRDRNA2_153539_c0~~gnl/MRDRNA2_/MRDRNA2_153539_c0_seq1.p1  ORF type:complete len:237 (+),score=46.12 gnl/MRDRNA2_/MRDRNA2_153539_c0_seq1:84-794(+)
MQHEPRADLLLQGSLADDHCYRQQACGKAITFFSLIIGSGCAVLLTTVPSTSDESAIGMASTHLNPSRATQSLHTAMIWPFRHAQKHIASASTRTRLQHVVQPTRGSPVIYAYSPSSVTDAWKNHFDAFGAQDIDKIALDYDETSRVTVYNNVDESKSVFKGVEEIKGMFKSLFADLSDLSTLAAPVIDVDEAPGKGGQVFLVWKCPGCGYDTATDTFIFGSDLKIKFQNIVVTKK